MCVWRVFVYLASLSNVHTYRGARYIAAGISGEEETSAEGKQLGLCLRPRRSVSNIPKIRVIHARALVIIGLRAIEGFDSSFAERGTAHCLGGHVAVAGMFGRGSIHRPNSIDRRIYLYVIDA